MSVEIDDEDDEPRKKLRVDMRNQNRVIAYIQALSQVVLNIVSGNTTTNDQSYRLIAATLSAFSEYLLESTFKIKRAATSAVRLIVTHGMTKLELGPADFEENSGFQKVYLNLKYIISSRFVETRQMENSLSITRTVVEKLNLPEQLLGELLVTVGAMKAEKWDYGAWTGCIGMFMTKMGRDFFKVLPMELI